MAKKNFINELGKFDSTRDKIIINGKKFTRFKELFEQFRELNSHHDRSPSSNEYLVKIYIGGKLIDLRLVGDNQALPNHQVYMLNYKTTRHNVLGYFKSNLLKDY